MSKGGANRDHDEKRQNFEVFREVPLRFARQKRGLDRQKLPGGGLSCRVVTASGLLRGRRAL